MNLLPNFYFTALLIFCFSFNLSSQITGKVTGQQSGEELIGATITFYNQDENMLTGAITDFDGNFILNIPSDKKGWIETKYIGYETNRIEVNLKKKYKIKLRPSQGFTCCSYVIIPKVKLFDLENTSSGETFDSNEIRRSTSNY